MNAILGGSGFSGRLMQNLREDKAYTYGARSSLSPDPVTAEFIASAEVRSEVTDSAIVEFLHEINRIRDTQVDSADLATAKASLSGRPLLGRCRHSGTLLEHRVTSFSGLLRHLRLNFDAVTIEGNAAKT